MYEYMGQLLLGKEKKIKSKRKESRHARGTRWIGESSAHQAEKRAATASVASRQVLPHVFEVQMFQK